MITKQNCVITDNISECKNINAELCILDFNILTFSTELKQVIQTHPQTTFWAATKDFSKNYVLTASKLGIKNIVKYPVKQELIDNFFQEKIQTNNKYESEITFEKLTDSKILIVDDNNMNISLLTEILSDLGTEIKTCTNPCDAINLINKEKFNLFLLDILMPEMSGFELAELIKLSGINSNRPIVFISAVSNQENILNGYNIGAFSYIEKPFHPNIVKAQIYNILKMQEDNSLKEQEKEQFVANLTHDLKSPINAEITALKYLLKSSPSNPDEILSEILNSAKYMKLITDNILCHYRHKNKFPELKKEPARLDTVIISCIEELKYLTMEKGLKIRFSNETQEELRFDVLEIKRVIMNLLTNAAEYSKQNGYIDITLLKKDNCVLFSIRNYGYGIDLKKHPDIFNKYKTLSKEQKKTGFGLGLNICKTIIEAHGGEINISSDPDKFTEVKFTIPS